MARLLRVLLLLRQNGDSLGVKLEQPCHGKTGLRYLTGVTNQPAKSQKPFWGIKTGQRPP